MIFYESDLGVYSIMVDFAMLLVKQLGILRTTLLEMYLKHYIFNYKKTKNKIESQKQVLEMELAIGVVVF